jgi:hypothetical protein
MRRPVYNLEFPPWCSELTIFGYCFSRVDNYHEQVLRLQHLTGEHAEFQIQPNTGEHVITAYVDLPDNEEDAILEWAGIGNTALMDILLLLSMLTGREVFAGAFEGNGDESEEGVILRDPRIYRWGGVLQASVPYYARNIEPIPYECGGGFEQTLNEVYALIRSEDWQRRYRGGYFLFLARQAFLGRTLESVLVQCWTIWEHLYAILNQDVLPRRDIERQNSVEKIAFLLREFALADEIDAASRNRIDSLARIRHRLVHFGRFPERDAVHDDAVFLVRLTEYILAIILGLRPSNVFNTVERLEHFLGNIREP